MSREFLPTTGAGPITCEPSTRPDSVDAEAVVVFMAEGGVVARADHEPSVSRDWASMRCSMGGLGATY